MDRAIQIFFLYAYGDCGILYEWHAHYSTLSCKCNKEDLFNVLRRMW